MSSQTAPPPPPNVTDDLINAWTVFCIARYSSSFIGIMNIYSIFIPYLEQRIAPLRALTKFDMNHDISVMLTPEVNAAKDDMIDVLCSDLCIAKYYFEKRP